MTRTILPPYEESTTFTAGYNPAMQVFALSMALSIASATSQPMVARDGDSIILRWAKAKIVLNQGSLSKWFIGGGLHISQMRYGPTFLLRDRTVLGEIVLKERLAEWLKGDSIWGGHPQANQLRYLNGLSPLSINLAEARQIGRNVLGVVTVHHDSMEAALLVKISVAPLFAIRPIRALDLPRFSKYAEPSSWLFGFGKKTLVFSRGLLSEIDASGESRRIFMRLPQQTQAFSYLMNQWLVLAPDYSWDTTTAYAVDLKAKRVKPLLSASRGRFFPASVAVVATDPMKGYVWCVLEGGRGEKPNFIFHLPSGKVWRRGLPESPRPKALWSGYAIFEHDDVEIRELLSEKLRYKLAVPRGP